MHTRCWRKFQNIAIEDGNHLARHPESPYQLGSCRPRSKPVFSLPHATSLYRDKRFWCNIGVIRGVRSCRQISREKLRTLARDKFGRELTDAELKLVASPLPSLAQVADRLLQWQSRLGDYRARYYFLHPPERRVEMSRRMIPSQAFVTSRL